LSNIAAYGGRMPSGDARTGLADRLAGTRFSAVRWVDEIDSTNRELLDEAREGVVGPAVLVADHQTAGRGRRDRRWLAPPGSSLLVSVLVRLQVAPDRLPLATAAAALATSDAVAEVAGVEAGLKWPNDVVVGERKLAGVLAEAVGDTVVVGVGTNVDWPGDLPPEIAETAVALNHLTDGAVDRADLLVAYLRALDRDLESLEADGGSALLGRYRDRCSTLTRQVRVDTDAGVVEGIAVDLTGPGHLVVETTEGTRVEVATGDVVHAR
jgi:BirA family biotin operon repressor/biotin-[acetyl-CoA-carboxylase] ligase